MYSLKVSSAAAGRRCSRTGIAVEAAAHPGIPAASGNTALSPKSSTTGLCMSVCAKICSILLKCACELRTRICVKTKSSTVTPAAAMSPRLVDALFSM